jgi:hypothetical protein
MAINSLYMPETIMDLAKDAFESPVALFQALELSTKAKTFINVTSMDQKLNQLQFMIQLQGSSYLLKSAADNKYGQIGRGSNFPM